MFFTYDLTIRKISKVGTPDSKTTDFAYLGLSEEVLMELENTQVVKSYQYAPTGKRLAMINHKDTGDQPSYYGYNTHTDVEMLYKPDGSVEGTYGYTAYGKEDKAATTGVDDPDPADNPDPNYDPDDPVNDYRYSAKRWDPSIKSYDMGFRDYSPGLNRFTTLDMYNGALADMGLSANPWTNNRYGFTGGNPISNVELDGHVPLMAGEYQTDPVGDYNRAISVGENLYGGSIKKDAGYDQRKAQEAFSLHVEKVDGLGNGEPTDWVPQELAWLEWVTLVGGIRKTGDDIAQIILNIGSGRNPLKGAINMDIKQYIDDAGNKLVDVVGDATKKIDFPDEYFDEIIAQNPRYNVLGSEINRVLKKGGTLNIVGNFSNKNFKPLWRAIEKGDTEFFEKMGYKVKDYYNHVIDELNFGTMRQTSGEKIEINSLKTIILEKLF